MSDTAQVKRTIESMQWTKYKTIYCKNGPDKEVRSAPATGDFWSVWALHKDYLKAAGYAVFNRDGRQWRVEQWVKKGQRPEIRTYNIRPRAERKYFREIGNI